MTTSVEHGLAAFALCAACMLRATIAVLVLEVVHEERPRRRRRSATRRLAWFHQDAVRLAPWRPPLLALYLGTLVVALIEAVVGWLLPLAVTEPFAQAMLAACWTAGWIGELLWTPLFYAEMVTVPFAVAVHLGLAVLPALLAVGLCAFYRDHVRPDALGTVLVCALVVVALWRLYQASTMGYTALYTPWHRVRDEEAVRRRRQHEWTSMV